jgi:hypothetical protein
MVLFVQVFCCLGVAVMFLRPNVLLLSIPLLVVVLHIMVAVVMGLLLLLLLIEVVMICVSHCY